MTAASIPWHLCQGRGAVHIDAVTIAIVWQSHCWSRDGHFRVSVHRQQGYGSDLLHLDGSCADADRRSLCRAAVLHPTELLEKGLGWPARRGDKQCWRWYSFRGWGHMVNGSRRWLQVAGLNFQASELARVLVLIYLASTRPP